MAELCIRKAKAGDEGLVLAFIRALAIYEKMEDEVKATEEGLRRSLFTQKQAEVLIGEWNGTPVAFALYFYNYSTFLGHANLYLEDLYVEEAYRGKGIGRAMFHRLARIAVEQGCARLDWWCLDWNQNAIDFYCGLGAVPMKEWTVYRLQGEELQALAEEQPALSAL